ncbi:hypothetical protein [Pelagicoccus sp. SDUM812003]|uniref:hypothetical protein n=1 Tax=Pelagicoccus sp. SDUM812003 TaxID=3041267 RepID=UPI00280EC81D|nr:hypothetical protein [Pelagicoccus sp. SDUM812003]MDQ8202163.1 hypothetical protein [Pelagicoccus sp. SDUM812003]
MLKSTLINLAKKEMFERPRKASEGIRLQIIDALKDPRRRFLDLNSSSRRFLDLWGITADGFFADLASGLSVDRLFLKPKTFPNQAQRYQCVLCYPEEADSPKLDVHVTLSPRGAPLTVKVAIHESNTAQTLPRIYPYTTDDEDREEK